MSVPAVIASEAGDLRDDEHSVSRLEASDRGSDFHDLRPEFVPLDQRRPRHSVPFDDIASADPAGYHLDQHFSGVGPAQSRLLNADILIVVPDGGFHALPHPILDERVPDRALKPCSESRSGERRRAQLESWRWSARIEKYCVPYRLRPPLPDTPCKPWSGLRTPVSFSLRPS